MASEVLRCERALVGAASLRWHRASQEALFAVPFGRETEDLRCCEGFLRTFPVFLLSRVLLLS